MLKEHSPQTIAETLRQSCKRLPTLGVIDSNGNCLIQSGFYPKIERVYLVGYIGDGSRGQVFPIQEDSRKNNVLPRQQDYTCTVKARHTADANGSYVIERKQHAQEVNVVAMRGRNPLATLLIGVKAQTLSRP